MEKSAWQWMIEPLRVYRTVIFPGRARRKEFWWFALLQLLIYVPFFVLIFATMPRQPSAVPQAMPPAFWLFYLLSMVLMLPNLSVSVRRLHDTNRSGWWLLLPSAVFVPSVIFGTMVGGSAAAAGNGLSMAVWIYVAAIGAVFVGSYITLLVWFCTRGTIGENRFGPDPITNAD